MNHYFSIINHIDCNRKDGLQYMSNIINSRALREAAASAEREFGGINDHLRLPTLPEWQRQKPIAANIYTIRRYSPRPSHFSLLAERGSIQQIPLSKMSSKLCFLTVGATASFSTLIEAAVSPAFLTALESQGYTELSVQYGQDGKQLFEKCKSIAQGTSKLKVTGFDLDKTGLGRHMRRAKGAKDAVEGVVISHAGMEDLMRQRYISM